ncbi:MAG: SpoIID/LytB domain-containing protein [Fibrobacterota bacterium]|nr:SpoIID/LytB domain-containing protein [Chitinispirillaceae bacterium]
MISDTAKATDSVDFASALDSISLSVLPSNAVQMVNTPDSGSVQHYSLRYPPFRVHRSDVRVLLKQKLTQYSFFSIGNVELHQSKGKTMVLRGRLNVLMQQNGAAIMEAAWGKITVHLPCTLVSRNEYNVIDLNTDSYRGRMILINDSRTTFAVVNELPVEEYLRGVVPLELGSVDKLCIEALKAQAIAARTYTYRKIGDRISAPFDLYATVADQVYGGFKPEYHDADIAIRLTKGLIIVYNDSIASAYYHSTCGGFTANIEDVWKNKPALEYLRSESDKDSTGRAYCADSKSFHWEERWSKDAFNKIVITSLNTIESKQQYKLPINKIDIAGNYSCGRIRELVISGTSWKYTGVGDQVRFILRRSQSGNPILKSANFVITSNTAKEVKVSGVGYGHGVGMCQTGAIARAKAGQTFEQILRAYYRGIVICTASE